MHAILVVRKSKSQVHESMQVVVATGFIASNLQGQVTTLKRNGSDYSATILGALFQGSHITIWTDVNGVYSADPRKVGPPALRHMEALPKLQSVLQTTTGWHRVLLHPSAVSDLRLQWLGHLIPTSCAHLPYPGPRFVRSACMAMQEHLRNIYTTFASAAMVSPLQSSMMGV